jgi:hypothetical protein
LQEICTFLKRHHHHFLFGKSRSHPFHWMKRWESMTPVIGFLCERTHTQMLPLKKVSHWCRIPRHWKESSWDLSDFFRYSIRNIASFSIHSNLGPLYFDWAGDR